ncbi:MAG: transglutaminase domain-containing protein [Pseudomonadota bacterium]
MSKRLAVLMALMLLPVAVPALEDQGLYLHVIPVDVLEREDDQDATLRLFIDNPEAVAATLTAKGMAVVASDTDSLTVSLKNARQTFSGQPDDWLSDTFVIDYSEPSVVDMLASDAWQNDAQPLPIEAMEDGVFDWISDKTYARNFDFASTVARTRSGDCTEHAVLLAAAARASGKPARVVLGLMLVDGESPFVYGHAWTEVWADGEWQLLDATKPEAYADAEALYYIPTGLLENESPSYAMSLFSLTLTFPARVELSR